MCEMHPADVSGCSWLLLADVHGLPRSIIPDLSDGAPWGRCQFLVHCECSSPCLWVSLCVLSLRYRPGWNNWVVRCGWVSCSRCRQEGFKSVVKQYFQTLKTVVDELMPPEEGAVKALETKRKRLD